MQAKDPEPMTFPRVTVADWRALVDRELAGASFEKTLVQRTAEGLSLQPLYTEGPESPAPQGLFVDTDRATAFRIAMRHEAGAPVAAVDEDLANGADAVWVPFSAELAERSAPFWIFDAEGTLEGGELPSDQRLIWGADPLARAARDGGPVAPLEPWAAEVAAMAEAYPRAQCVRVSTLPFHDAGADAADELAFALSTGAAYLEALLGAGLTPDAAAAQVSFQLAVGRETFNELCKVRALRVGWSKVLAAAGATQAPRPLVHAVCSSRTMSLRDPWVNLLRVTTQVFAGVLGGADLVTPLAYDAALGTASPLGHRTARNTGLVLRDESALGRVMDPAGGSYYLETLTDALAREAWRRFQALEAEGGMAAGLDSGRIRTRLERAWSERLEALRKRKAPVLGVSDFANLDERVVSAGGAGHLEAAALSAGLPSHRDSEPFEALRSRAERLALASEAVLVALGTLAETRPRVGFAAGFFTAGGIRTREGTVEAAAPLVCLCGTDERYAAEAAERARALKTLGVRHVLVAGRPGALEATLREAGVDGFIHVGCDAAELLGELLEVFR